MCPLAARAQLRARLLDDRSLSREEAAEVERIVIRRHDRLLISILEARAISEGVMPKMLIGAGVALILAGLLWLVAERFGLGRLPGDIIVDRGGFRIYVPITTSLIVSVVLSLFFWMFGR
jgi:hypothetical protein